MNHHDRIWLSTLTLWLAILTVVIMAQCGCGYNGTSSTADPLSEAHVIERRLIDLGAQKMLLKGCWLDGNCDDHIGCNGKEWCCSPRGKSTWNCEPLMCYEGLGPCGTPIASVLSVCDLIWDTCRGCYTDEECNLDTRTTHTAWGWCGGPRRCGREDEAHHYGVCLSAGPFPCEWYQRCNEKEQRCDECLRDRDCGGLETWCDENGKCRSL